ncbi:MAG: adenylate/guanylate cyclase domain-containing protein [Candidatus Neomarinimicrobiota bacterium]|nr:adenylate/guanylate cyclase domain-containing protein [Candidatus Neomarinimicrobiota bacterium]
MNQSEKSSHKLAVIMFTDIVGYSKLVQTNEDKALEILDEHNHIVRPIIDKYDGSEIKTIGDAFLIQFESAISALNCAIEVQKKIVSHNAIQSFDKKFQIRIGIHLGDIVIKDNDVFGDGVNIANRIESQSEPGGICISDQVYYQVRRKINYKFSSIGHPKLKNIEDKIEVFKIIFDWDVINDNNKKTKNNNFKKKLPIFIVTSLIFILMSLFVLNFSINQNDQKKGVESRIIDKQSIAVLPFNNFSSKPEDQYFSDGLTEVIIANLAKIKDLKVISRTSVMQYKNSEKSLFEIGKELGVAHILEGSVQKSDKRIRIVGQLIDAQTDEHLWAETYDRVITDLFDIQIDVSTKIAQTLKTELSNDEINVLSRKSTENLEAYDFYLKAIEYQTKSYSEDDTRSALFYSNKAIELDSNYVEALSLVGSLHLHYFWAGYDRSDKRKEIAKNFIDKAIFIDPNNPLARLILGLYHYLGHRDYYRALEELNYVKQEMPGNQIANEMSAYIYRRMGKFEYALERILNSYKTDPNNSRLANEVGRTCLLNRDYENAIKYYNKAIELAPNQSRFYCDLSKVYYHTGNLELAIEILSGDFIHSRSDDILYNLATLYFMNKQYDKSLEILNQINTLVYTFQYEFKPISMLKALNYQKKNDIIRAKDYFLQSKEIFEKAIKENTKDPRIHADYGLLLAYFGEKEQAINSAKTATNMVPMDKDAIIGTEHFITLTKVYTLLKEYEIAEQNLDILKQVKNGPTNESLAKDPIWETLNL